MFGQFIPDIFLASSAGWNDHEQHDEFGWWLFFFAPAVSACLFQSHVCWLGSIEKRVLPQISMRDSHCLPCLTSAKNWWCHPQRCSNNNNNSSDRGSLAVNSRIVSYAESIGWCIDAYIVALSWQCLRAYQNVRVDKQRVIIAVTNTTSFTLPRANMTTENCNTLSW